MYVCTCTCVCVHVGVRCVCTCACAYICVRACTCVCVYMCMNVRCDLILIYSLGLHILRNHHRSQLGSGMGWPANIAAGHTNTSSQWNSGSGAVSSMGTTGSMGTGPLLIHPLEILWCLNKWVGLRKVSTTPNSRRQPICWQQRQPVVVLQCY